MRVPIASDSDIVTARQKGRELSGELHFSPTDLTIIATAISELARNIVQYAGCGEIVLSPIEFSDEHGTVRTGIAVVAQDNGRGIPNISQAMRDGFSTSGSLGLGLPGVKRLMDEFEIISDGRGTIVTVKKWKR